MLPPHVRDALRGAKREVRDGVRAARRRLSRPNLYRLDTPERVGVVFNSASDMRIDERLYLYSFVRGFKAERALEIGVARGGSAAIITNAMEDNGRGKLVGIDPEPNILFRWRDLHGRYTLLKDYSPQAIPAARDAAGGQFDFVLIDGLHTHDQVVKDLAGVLPYLADGAYVLFHDAFHYGIATAIKEAVDSDPRLTDCGYPCRTARIENDPWTPYNGFRLLRFAATAGPRTVDVERVVEPIYASAGRAAPPLRRDTLNHDGWYCRAVSPCERCRAEKGLGAPVTASAAAPAPAG